MVRIVSTVVLALGLAALLPGCMESPAAQAEKIRAAAQPGASWEQVVAVHAPKKYADVHLENASGRTALQEFNKDVFAKRVADRENDQGYALQYIFSADEQFEVMLDAEGKVEGIEKMTTMKDLLNRNL
jgi:hypothetical protein